MTEKIDLYCNKYNAKTENQYKFGKRIEREYGLICNFDFYSIVRGRGWSKSAGSCSIAVGVRHQENPCALYLLLYAPLKNYLSKKKFLSAWHDSAGISVELESKIPTKTKFASGYSDVLINKTRGAI